MTKQAIRRDRCHGNKLKPHPSSIPSQIFFLNVCSDSWAHTEAWTLKKKKRKGLCGALLHLLLSFDSHHEVESHHAAGANKAQMFQCIKRDITNKAVCNSTCIFSVSLLYDQWWVRSGGFSRVTWKTSESRLKRKIPHLNYEIQDKKIQFLKKKISL